jgi:substrate-binding family protein
MELPTDRLDIRLSGLSTVLWVANQSGPGLRGVAEPRQIERHYLSLSFAGSARVAVRRRTLTGGKQPEAGYNACACHAPPHKATQQTTFVDAAKQPGAEHFVAEFKKRFGVRQVDRYAVEAYDALFLVAQGMSALGKGGVERGAMARRLRELSYKGLAKAIAFEPLTRVMPPETGQFLYRVEGGRVRFLGHYAKVRSTGS